MLSGRRILFAPLDWGMGHATRSVPIIRQLLHNNNTVVLGLTPLTAPLLTHEFPDLECVELPAYNLRYSSNLPLWLKLLFDWPRISGIMHAEHGRVLQLVEQLRLDVVVSDSRFGLWADKAHTILITHQVFLKAPFATALARRLNRKFLLRFDELWVPDRAELKCSLAGELSHGRHFHPHVTYIGPQSRLLRRQAVPKDIDCLFLVSGPEPQNRALAAALAALANRHPQLKFAAAGIAGQRWPGNVSDFSFAGAELLSDLFARSTRIICRSGYSSLMDANALDFSNLILVPTPGQSEQRYLAWYWEQRFGCRVCKQNDLDALEIQE